MEGLEGLEFMPAERFQYLLREFGGPLEKVEVTHESEAMKTFSPWNVQVRGVVQIHGNPRVFEFDIDLRSVQKVEHISHIAAMFLRACEKATQQPQVH